MKKFVFDHFGPFLTIFEVLKSPLIRGQPNIMWPYNTVALTEWFNSTTWAIYFIILFKLLCGSGEKGDCGPIGVISLFGYLSDHQNQIWPINLKALLVRSIPTTPVTFLITFSSFGWLPCRCGEKCNFCLLWAFFDHYWGNWGVNWINYGHITLKHCMVDLIQQALQYVWCFFHF